MINISAMYGGPITPFVTIGSGPTLPCGSQKRRISAFFFSSFVAELSWQVGSSHQGDWLKGTIRTGWKINPPNLHKTSSKKQTKTANGIYIIPGLQNFALLIYVTFFFSEHQKSINQLPGEFRDFAIRRTLPRFLPSLAQRNWPSLVD